MAEAKCVAGYSWMFNSLNQSPCDIAVALAGVCNGGVYQISPLDSGYYYLGPSVDTATDCKCNTVYYSLLAACSVCQVREFITWSSFMTNCVTVYKQRYPELIPTGTAVPNYAYLDVMPANNFNITAAQVASGPESTAPPRVTHSATGTTTPTALITSSSTSTPFVSTDPSYTAKKPNTGAIAGGVVGGVVGLALLGTLLFLLLRRRNTPSPPSSAYDPMMASQNAASLGGSPYPSPTFVGGMQQPYPLTYANQVPTNYTGTSATSGGKVRSHYSGMPEV